MSRDYSLCHATTAYVARPKLNCHETTAPSQNITHNRDVLETGKVAPSNKTAAEIENRGQTKDAKEIRSRKRERSKGNNRQRGERSADS